MTPTSHSLTSNTNEIITVVFMVGYNMEWYTERCMYGDIALYYHWLLFFNHHHHHDNTHKENELEVENKHYPTRIQFVHEYDMDDMTSTQLQERLSVFLDDVQHQYRGGDATTPFSSSTNIRIQLVLYIGGHGESGYYCWTRRRNHHYTNSNDRNSIDDSDDHQYQECWYYKDIITLLRQKLLPTDMVYLLVDTCYSGSILYEFDDCCCSHDNSNNTNYSTNSNNNKDVTTSSIQLSKTQPEPPSSFPKWYTRIQNPNMEVSFMIFMSTKDDCMAGPEWTLTQGWIEAMMGQYHSHHHSMTPPSIREVVYTLRDKIDRIKHNEMQFLYVYSIDTDTDDSSHTPTGGQMDTTMFPFLIPLSLSSLPITSPSSLLDDNPCIRFHDWRVIKEYKKSRNWWWNCICPYRTKHGTNDHSTMMNYYYQMIAFRLLANNGQYRYYSNFDRGNSRPNGPSSDRANVLIPPNRDRYIVGAKVWCIWEDHTQLYLGTIMDDINVSWEDFIPTNWTNDGRSHDRSVELSMSLPNLDQCYGIGPCIPVQWDNEPSWSFLPIGQCYVVVPDDIQQQQQQKDPPKFHQVQELAYNTMRNVLRQQFVISSSGTIQRPISIPMDCLLRNFHSMGKELYFTSHDIYHEILRSNDTECNGMISIQDFNDMDTVRFVPCPTIRHLLLEYLIQCENQSNNISNNKKKNKNDNNHRNIDRGDDYYWMTVTKQVRSIHDVMEEMLWTHVWYNTTTTTTTFASSSSSYNDHQKYCIMMMMTMKTMNSLVDIDTNHHKNDSVMDTSKSENDHSIPLGYICVPIASLRIKESESEMRNREREISNINDDNIQMNL